MAIKILYGYGFDKLKGEELEWLDEEVFTDGIEYTTGYSVSSYEPDTATIGIEIDDTSMFWQTELKTSISPAKKAIVDAYVIPKFLKKKLINKKPAVLVFGYTDD